MRDIFSVLRDYRLFGGDDEGGSGGGSDKTYDSLADAAKDGQHGKAVNIKGKGLQKVEFADKSYDKKMSTASSKASTGGYTGLKDMFDGGGPGKSGATFGSGGGGRADTNNDGYVSAAEARANPLSQNFASSVGNYVAGGGALGAIMGGGGGSSAPRPPRQRIGTKGMTSAQRKALTDAGYEVTKGGSVKKNGGTVAGSNFSGSREVDAIMNSGPLSGERGSFGDAFAAARKKAGGDGGTFTFGGKQFTTNIDTAPKTSLRPKLRPTTAAPAAAPIVDYDSLYEAEAYGPGGIGAAPFGSYAPQSQAANFYTDPSASTAAVYPQAADFSRTDLPPGSYEVASSGNAFEKFLNSVGLLEDKNTGEVSTTYNRTDGPVIDTIPDLGSDPSDNREPRGMYDSPSIVLPDELIGAPMGYVPEPLTYNEIIESIGAEITPEARTAPLSDYDADRLKPGLSQPLQARIKTPEEDAIERARAAARGDIYSPDLPGPNSIAAVRDKVAKQYAEQQRDPEPPGLSYDELVAAGLAQGFGTTSRAAQDATNVIAPPDMLADGADFVGPFRPGMEPKAGVPMVVGQQSKVATEAAIAAEGASNVFNRVKNNMDRDTRAAIERRIFPDGIGSFDSEAAKAQFVMQGASMFPLVAAMVANPGLGMTVGGGMAIADVGQQIDANIDARNQAGELGQLNPSQVQAIKLLAREKAALPSAVVGGTAARLLGTNPIAGIVADVISEVGLEPSIAEGAAFFQTGTDVKTENLLAQNPADVAFLSGLTSGAIAPAAVAGQAMNTASAPPVVQTEAPTQDSLAYKAGQGIGNFTPPKAFSDAATLTATTMGGTPKMPSAVAPDAAAKVISGSGSNVAPAPAAQTVAPVQTLPENLGLPSLLNTAASNKVVQMTSPTALSANNQAQYTTPSFVPDGTAQLQAATIEDTGTGVTVDAPTPLTPEQIANVSPQAGAELDAALDVAPTTAVDAAPTQIDKNGASRPENVSAAIDLLKTDGKNSASYLQRKLRINYSEASEINKQLEAEGYISAPDKIGRRKILKTEPTPTPENRALQILQKARVQQNKGSNSLISKEDAKILEAEGLLEQGASNLAIASNQSVADLLAQGPEAVKAKLKAKTKTNLDALTDQQLIDTVGGKPKSVGAAAGRSGVVDAILRKNPDYLPFGFDFNLGTDLDTRLQDIAFQQAQENREAGRSNLGATPPDTIGRVPKRETQSELLLGDMGSTRQYSIYDSDGNIRDDFVPSRFAPTAKGQYTGEQIAAQMNRERLARQERGETEAAGKAAGVEAIEASDAALLSGLPVDPAGVGSLRNFPSNIPLVDSPAAQRDRQIANAQREKARLEAEAMAPLNRAQAALDAVVDPVPAAIQSVEAQRAEMLAANKTYQDYINTRAQISALDGVTKEQAEREAFAAVEQRIEDQQQRLLNAVNAEGGTAAITNAANNEIAKLEAQLNAVKEVILNERTPRPVNFPPAPYKTTGETLMEKAAITTPVEVAEMAPLVPPASPESVGEADITPPTLAEFIEIQRAKPRDGVPVDPLAATVEMPPSQQEQLALDLQGGSAVTTPEGIMSLVDRTSKAPAAMDAVNPVASPEISFEEAMAKVAEEPTARAPKDADPLVLTDPVTQGGIASAVPGRIPKDKLPTRFQSDLPVVDPFSRENQLARQAANRARFAAQENELAAAQGLTPASKPVGSTEVISRTDEEIARDNQIEQDRRNARNAALRGLASLYLQQEPLL